MNDGILTFQCPVCRGRKVTTGIGNIQKPCQVCDGTGRVTHSPSPDLALIIPEHKIDKMVDVDYRAKKKANNEN